MRDVKEEDPLAIILRSAKVLDEDKIQQAVLESQKVGMPLAKALEIKGEIAKSTLALFSEAANQVSSGRLSLDVAIRASRLANNESLSFDEAKAKLKNVHRATVTVSSIANELLEMMQEANIINSQQLRFAVINGESSGMLPGRVLLLNKAVSVRGLASSISACLMLRQKKLLKADLIEALKRAHKKNCSLEQAMFEQGTFKQPQDATMKLSDLLVMGGLISESDLLECRELSITKNKSFKQIVIEQGLLDNSLLNMISKLQNMVASEQLKPYSAARALYSAVKQGANFQLAISEQQANENSTKSDSPILGQLLFNAGAVTEAGLSEVSQNQATSNIKIGKVLLSKGIINDDTLVKALRTQSSIKYGYIEEVQAVNLLKTAVNSHQSLEIHCKQMGLYIPTHVQWSWV